MSSLPHQSYPTTATTTTPTISFSNSTHHEDTHLILHKEKRKKNIGKAVALFFIITGLIITWVALAELLQVAQHDKGYDKPLFLTYLVHGLYIIFLPIYWIVRKIYYYRLNLSTTQSSSSSFSSAFSSGKYNSLNGEELGENDPYITTTTTTTTSSSINHHKTTKSSYHTISYNSDPITTTSTTSTTSTTTSTTTPTKAAVPFTLKRYLWTTFILHFVFFFCAMTYYYSLNHTSVAANTAIYNSNSVAVFILSVFLLGQKISVLSVISVLVSVGGVCMISFAPTSDDNSDDSGSSSSSVSPSALGYIAVIVSTVLYAIYEVLYRSLCVDTTVKDRVLYMSNSFFVLGMLGFWNLVIVWPVFFLANATGWESFEWPPLDALPYLIGAAAVDSVFQILLYIGILISSPLFISVGCMLSIPGSIVADYIFHSTVLPPLALGGIAVIIVGFIGINYSEYRDHKQQTEEKKPLLQSEINE